MKKGCKHHSHSVPKQHTSAQDVLAFFECCLKDEPQSLPDKITKLRKTLEKPQISETPFLPDKFFTVSADMIVADLLLTFPHLKEYFHEHHPLGLLSPMLDQTSVEMYFADFPTPLEDICQDLTNLIAQKQLPHV